MIEQIVVTFLLLFIGGGEDQIKEWTTEWWQWVFNINEKDLFIDPTGSSIMKHQPVDGDVFFLTGAVNMTATRDVVIPQNKTIILPIYNGVQYCANCNIFNIHKAHDALVEISNSSEKVDYLEARLDGKLIPYHEIVSDMFDLTITDNNPLSYVNDIGKTMPAVSDGFWVILHDLSLGNHTLYSNGIAADGYTSEVTYNMEIV